MKINISKKQYQTLIKSMDMAVSVYGISGDMVDDKYKKTSKEIDELISHFLSFASDFGMEEAVELHDGKYYLKSDHRFGVIDDLMNYEDYAFFDGLVRRLAKKELARKYSQAEFEKLSEEERLNIVFELEDKYWSWIDEDGFDDWQGLSIDQNKN